MSYRFWWFLALTLPGWLRATAGEPGPVPGSSAAIGLQQTAPKATITEVPFFQVYPTEAADLLPFKSAGIRFQRGRDLWLDKTLARTRNIGDARLAGDGTLFLTFPEKNLVAAFDQSDQKTRYFGLNNTAAAPPQPGGATSQYLIKDPCEIFLIGKRIYLNNFKNGKMMVYNREMEFENLLQFPVPAPLAGQGDRFLLISPENPNALVRANSALKMEQQYLLNDDTGRDGDGSRLVFDILPDWQLVAARRNGSRIYHLLANSQHLRQLALNGSRYKGSQSGILCSVHAVRLVEEQYWLLISLEVPGQDPQNLLLVVGSSGELVHCWKTLFAADGLDLNHQYLLLFHRENGEAETYRRF